MLKIHSYKYAAERIRILKIIILILIFHFRAACWCGNQYPSEKFKISDVKCNAICSGDTSKNCGGLWRLSVYSTGIVG